MTSFGVWGAPPRKKKSKKKPTSKSVASPSMRGYAKPSPKQYSPSPTRGGAYSVADKDTTLTTLGSLEKAMVFACKHVKGTTQIAYVLDKKAKKKYAVAYVGKGRSGYFISMCNKVANRVDPNSGKLTKGDII